MSRPAQIAPRLLAALARPQARPVAVQGRSGSGKTTLLRGLTRRAARDVVWASAFDVVNELTDAIRKGSDDSYRASLCDDDRPFCLEHLEDLRGKPRTRQELRCILEAAARRRPVLLTLTRSRGDGEIRRWLRPWADVLSLD